MKRRIPTTITGVVDGVHYVIDDEKKTLTIAIGALDARPYQRALPEKMYGRPKRVIERWVLNFRDTVLYIGQRNRRPVGQGV